MKRETYWPLVVIAMLMLALAILCGCRALGYDHQTWPGGAIDLSHKKAFS
jgi:hypothetical protein